MEEIGSESTYTQTRDVNSSMQTDIPGIQFLPRLCPLFLTMQKKVYSIEAEIKKKKETIDIYKKQITEEQILLDIVEKDLQQYHVE